jgi:cardiolipin synthase
MLVCRHLGARGGRARPGVDVNVIQKIRTVRTENLGIALVCAAWLATLFAAAAAFASPADDIPIDDIPRPGGPAALSAVIDHAIQVDRDRRTGQEADRQRWFSKIAYGGQKLTMLDNGNDTTAARLALIRGARSWIYLSTYAFGGDEYATMFAKELCKRAYEGLDVRLLLDGHGSSGSRTFEDRLRGCGARVLYFNPPRWDLAGIRYVIHEKLLIADGEKLIIGGSGYENIYRHYARHDSTWYDMDLLVEGPAACWFQNQFANTWKQSTYRDEWDDGMTGESGRQSMDEQNERVYGVASLKTCESFNAGDSRVATDYHNPMLKDGEPLSDLYFRAMAASHGKIKLYAPYFVPTQRFVDNLITLSRDLGVQVQILTNSTTSIDPEARPVVLATMMAAPKLLAAGVKIYLWPFKNTMHRKGGVYDGKWAYFGSDNLDRGGANYQSEDVLFTDDSGIVSKLEGQMDEDFALATPLTQAIIDQTMKESSFFSRDIATPVIYGWL